jgi:hypothetical protein
MKIARGQSTTMPTQEMIRLTLKAFDSLSYFLTKTTAKPEVAADNNAKVIPIMAFFEGCGYIKIKRACIGKFFV